MKYSNPHIISRLTKKFLSGIFLVLISLNLKATHIVGAELYYECLNPTINQYRITIKFFRNCKSDAEANFDDPIDLFVFPVSNPGSYSIYQISKPPNTPEIIPPEWSQCTGSVYDICVQEGIYTRTLTLPPSSSGYDIGWARCCRNKDIDNLLNPLDQGVTFVAHIPGSNQATCNSMPQFDNRLPIFICAGEDLFFDHSATDPDGDSLVYRITNPYTGLNYAFAGAGNDTLGSPPPVVNGNNPMGPPPYQNVTFSSGYNYLNPFGPGSISIDNQSGWVHINAPSPGIFVFAISVFEYRNGILLSENKRDMQVNVVNCLPQNDPPQISHDLSGLTTNGDTIIIQANDNPCYTVTLSDPNLDPLAVVPISTIFFGGNAPSINISGSNPLDIDICWQSLCEYSGQTIELVLMGYDQNNCPIYNPVFDTIFIRIIPPPDVQPAVGHDLPPTNPLGPDTLYLEVDSTVCFTMFVADTSFSQGPVSYDFDISTISGGGNFSPGISPDFSFQDSISFEICVTPGCDNIDALYRLILEGTADAACPPNNKAWDTVYFYVSSPPNPPPTIFHDLAGNILNGDTIVMDVHTTACYEVTINDTFPSNGLNYLGSVVAVDAQPSGGVDPVVTVVSTNDSLVLEVCWTANCDNVERLFMLILRGSQDNLCEISPPAYDTVYIRVNDVYNPPPIISHSFLPGYEISGDTITIASDSTACYDFQLRDTVVSSYLSVTGQAYVLSSGDSLNNSVNVSITTNQDTLLEGTVCFNPGCNFVDIELMVVLTGKDTFDCNPANWVYDTVYLNVVEPYNNPPVITHDLSGLTVENDTVKVIPKGEPYCYTVELTDPDSLYANLIADGFSRIFFEYFDYGNPGSVEVSGTNPLRIDVCWDPSCYDSKKSFELVICGEDTSRCSLTPVVCDTVLFYVEDCSVEVQNVFTPNGDGINDIFIPYDISGVESYEMQVFDRWGKLVFRSSEGGWDGSLFSNGGNKCPEGVYYYIFEYLYYSAKGVPLREKFVGWVTLVR